MHLLICVSFLLQFLICGIFTDDISTLMSKFHQNEYIIKPERAEVVRCDTNFFSKCTLRSFKYNRTIIAFNTTFGLNVDTGYEGTGIAQVYKFMSNEYRHFPIRMQLPICMTLKENLIGLGTFKCGNFTGCPIQKGKLYHVCNWIPDDKRAPPLIPPGRYMIKYSLFTRVKKY